MSNASCFRDFNINNLQREVQLNRYITVAPLHQSYALCIEYMKHWFLEKFSKDFFSYIHLDGANVFGELNRIDKKTIISKMSDDKAILTILPTIDDSYNRDKLDMNLFGIDQFINTTRIDKSFIQDPVNDKYLMMKMDMILMNFTYRMKVSSRAMQLDIQKYMKLAFRSNLSESKDVDLDYVIPYPLILNMASDLGFEIKDDKVVEPISFLTYLNSRSYIPITYRRSAVNAREEYFVRVDHLPVRIFTNDINKDDGNKYGHLVDDFTIEMSCEVRFPSMQLYVYFSKNELKTLELGREVYNIDNTLMMSLHYFDDPPSVNDMGWKLYVNTQWQEDDYGDINIDLDELFEGELKQMIDKHLKRFTSPSVFIDIQVYNNGEKMKSETNWDKMIVSCKNQNPKKLVSTLAIYIDLNYLNNQRIDNYTKEENMSKVIPSKPNRT